MQWGNEEFRITRLGLQSALLAEGALPLAAFFGMLNRNEFRVSGETAFPPPLVASFRVIGARLRDAGRDR